MKIFNLDDITNLKKLIKLNPSFFDYKNLNVLKKVVINDDEKIDYKSLVLQNFILW